MADLTGMMQAAAGVSTGNPNAWDISKAYYDVGADAGDLSKAVFNFQGSIAIETLPLGVFFKPDGTKMYIAGNSTDSVREYNTLAPWRSSNFSFVQSKGISAQDTNIADVFFKPDGTKMYITGATNYKVYEYDLSTAWDVSSASFTQDFSVSSQGTNPSGIYFKPDGTKMYTTDNTSDTVNEYSLSTPWDISTASYDQNFSVSTQDSFPNGLSFLPDGTKMYVIGSGSDKVYQYSLSTPWDVSSASFVQDLGSLPDTIPTGFFMKAEGDFFYFTGLDGDSVYGYVIGGFSVAAQETAPSGIFFKPDGTKMYISGLTGQDINEYDLSTAWDITTSSYVQNYSVVSQAVDPQAVSFKGDGTKMYVLDSETDDVFEYALSSAWDISTASYTTSFSFTSQDTSPTGMFFKPDGTKMYIVGLTNDTVYQYSLSTAWDVSSASYDSISFSVSAEEVNPRGLFFKTDGTKMYIVGTAGDDVNEYDLATAWNVSTASYVQSCQTYSTFPTDIYFRENGEEFFVVDSTIDKVYRYLISEE